jgi:predicted nucleic acid-binding protein
MHQLLSTDFYPMEVANALTRAERKGIIAIGDADPLLLRILQTPPTLYDSMPVLRRAVAISSSTRQGLYDCLYVALAEREGCELVTSDDKLVKNLQPQFPFIVSLHSLP